MNIINLNDKIFNNITDFDIIDLRNIEPIGSKGNLIKWVFKPNDGRRNVLHIKTGKILGGNTLASLKFGIEPLVELLTYHLCELMNLKVAKERINLALIKYKKKEFLTIVNISEDFKGKNKENMTHLFDFFEFKKVKQILKNNNKLNYKEVIDMFKNQNVIDINYTDSEIKILQMIIFDYIILNTDRHNENFGYLVEKSKRKFEFAPIYDNGQSLLYDIEWDKVDWNKVDISNPILYKSHLKTIEFNNYFYKNLIEAEKLIYSKITLFGTNKKEIKDYIDYNLDMNLFFNKKEISECIKKSFNSYNIILNIYNLMLKNSNYKNLCFKINKVDEKWFTFMSFMIYNRTHSILNGFEGKYDN